MIEPDLYAGKGGTQARNHTRRVLKNNFHLVKWHTDRDNFVMDLGCGPATTTVNILLPMLPENVKMTGCDISEKMIEYARRHNSKENLNFMVLDVGTRDLPKELCGKFDQIFSFYCLNWIHEQRPAFKNIFDMLQPGGSILTTIPGRGSFFEAMKNLQNDTKWMKYFENASDMIKNYYFDDDQIFAERLKKMMEDVGLVVEVLEITHDTYVHDNSEDFQVFARSLNNIEVPTELFPEYLAALEEVVNSVHVDRMGSTVHHTNQVAFILARKPL